MEAVFLVWAGIQIVQLLQWLHGKQQQQQVWNIRIHRTSIQSCGSGSHPRKNLIQIRPSKEPYTDPEKKTENESNEKVVR